MELSFIELLIICVVINYSASQLSIIDSSSTRTELLDATVEIIEHFYSERTSGVNLIASLSNDRNRDFCNNVIQKSIMVPIYNENVHHLKPLQRKRFFNVILVDNIVALENFFNTLTPELYSYRGFYLIVLVNGFTNGWETFIKQFWDISIFHLNFLVQTKKSASMFTFKPFSSLSCGNTSAILTNRFKNGSFVGKKYFIKSTHNLHNCPIKVVTFDCPPAMMMHKIDDNNYDLQGIDGKLLTQLAVDMNFKIQIVTVPNEDRRGTLDINGTSTGAMKMVIDGDVDLTIGMYTITTLRNKFMRNSQPYFTIPFILIIPPGAPLSPFTKLFRPFQDSVWFFLLTTFIVGSFVITIIKLQSIAIRNFVFGHSNNTPYVNILNIFFGGSMHLLPSRNFARSLLMIFILFCLVKRSLYQGALFQFLQSNERAKPAQSIKELMTKDFNFYMTRSKFEYTNSLKFAKR